MQRLLLLTASLALATPTPASSSTSAGNDPTVLILNEIRIDMPGSDDDEYAELIGGPSGASLDNVTYIVIGDGAGESGTIEAAVPLTGGVINSLGLVLIGESTMGIGVADIVATLNFENSDNVTHMLVLGFTGAEGDDLDTNDDGVLDVMPWSQVYDAVSLVETQVPNLGSGEEHFYAGTLGFTDVGPDGSFVPGHVFRCINAANDWRIGGFTLGTNDSPGDYNADCSAQTIAFCDPPSPNSFSLSGGLLGLEGSGSIQRNDNALVAISVPAAFGVFVQSDMLGSPLTTVLGGEICLRGSIQRLHAVVFPSGNVARIPLDFMDPTAVEGTTLAGLTVYYQFFHRDTFFPGGGNWTSGIGVTWAP